MRIIGWNALGSRREFLRAAAIAGGMAVACPRSTLGAASRWKMRLTLSSVMFSELSVEDFCAEAARLGFKSIDLWCPFDKCRHLEEAASRLGPAGFKRLLAKHKLTASTFTVYRTGTSNLGFPAYAEFIGACGGGLVVRESEYGSFPAAEVASRMRSFLNKLEPEIELAARNHACLVIENHGDALLNSLDSFKAFTELNPDPKHLGLGLAPYHLQSSGTSVEQVIRTCGSQLRFVYAWQKADGTAQLPGIGTTDFTPWLKALAAIRFAGVISPFMHGHLPAAEMSACVSKSVAYLKSCKVDY